MSVRALSTATVLAAARLRESDGAYTTQCSDADGASVLQISGSPVLNALPDATWGLYLADADIALGNLVKDVTHQARRYLARHR